MRLRIIPPSFYRQLLKPKSSKVKNMINGQTRVKITHIRYRAPRILFNNVVPSDGKEIKSGFVFVAAPCEKSAYVLS